MLFLKEIEGNNSTETPKKFLLKYLPKMAFSGRISDYFFGFPKKKNTPRPAPLKAPPINL